MAIRYGRGDVKQTTTGFRGPLMVQSLTSAKSKFLSLNIDASVHLITTMKVFLSTVISSLTLLSCIHGVPSSDKISSSEIRSPQTSEKFEYNGEPIHPSIIQDLTTWLSDTGDQIVAINLTDSMGSNRYCCESDVTIRQLENGRQYIYIANDDERTSFGYTHIGQIDSGIHVLSISDWGGGSGVFKGLMLVSLKNELGGQLKGSLGEGGIETFTFDQQRVVIKKLGELGLGDRYDGDLHIEGNTIMISEDQGWFSVSGGLGGGPIKNPVQVHVGDR